MKNIFQKSIDILRAVQYNTFCSEQKERKIENRTHSSAG